MRDDFQLPRKLLFVAGIFAVMWFCWAIGAKTIAKAFMGATSIAEAGAWGDSFAVLTSFVSTLAFIGALAAFLMQGEALTLQRKDSNAARQEAHRQRFESSFFQLLELMRELRGQISFLPSYGYSQQPGVLYERSEGVNAIAVAAGEVDYWISFHSQSAPIIRAQLVGAYQTQIHAQSEAGLGAYFRIIYTILRRISEDPFLEDNEKISYGNLLRSQLTSGEVGLLGVNGLTSAANNLSIYLTEFRMLKYLPDGALRSELEKHYSEQTFLPRD